MRYWRAIAAVGLLASGGAFADPIYPPPPLPSSDCAAGSSITGYPSVGSPLGAGGHCGTPVASGTINTSTVGQVGGYTGTGTITGFTPTGDLSFTSPSFTINAGAVTGSKIASSVALAGAPTTTTPSTADSSTKIATTAYVQAQGFLIGSSVSASAPVSYDALTRVVSMTGPSALTTFSPNILPKGNGTSAFTASSIVDAGLGVTTGSPVGGAQGLGTINTTGLFINGVAVGSGGGGATTCQGLTNAAASCFIDTTNAANINSGDLTAARMANNFSTTHDVAFGSAPGNIIYRGTSNWLALAPGTAGQVLSTQGAAAPQWIGLTTMAGGTTGQIQINNSGSLAGLTVGGALTTSGSTLNVASAGVSSAMLASGAAATNVGALSQDLSGTLPGPMVVRINGASLGDTSPASGNVLFGSGTQWISRAITGDVTISSTGVAAVTIQNGSITAPKLAAGVAASNLGAAGQDLSGTFPNPTVIALQGRGVSNAAPSAGNLLGWNGTAWGPTTAPVTGINQLTGAVTSGPGSGTQVATITPTGVTSGKYTVRSDSGATTDCWTVASTGQIVLIEVATPCAALATLTGNGVTLTGNGVTLTQ